MVKMTDKIKLLLFLVFLILTSIISGVIRMKTADSFKEFMQGVPLVLVPILLIVLYIWIRFKIDDYKLEQHRDRVRHKREEREKEERFRQRQIEIGNRLRAEEVALKRRVEEEQQKSARIADAKEKGLDVCEDCGTIKPNHCRSCGKCISYKCDLNASSTECSRCLNTCKDCGTVNPERCGSSNPKCNKCLVCDPYRGSYECGECWDDDD